MSNKTIESQDDIVDPYAVLEVSPEADDATIRKNFHRIFSEQPNNVQVRLAYELIRNESNRRKFKWSCLTSVITPYPKANNQGVQKLNIDALAKELAFLSDWELGDNT